MKLCYVDETGTDGRSPVVVMVGIIADSQRLRRTQEEFNKAFKRLTGIQESTVRELKSTHLYRGTGKWRGVDGEVRHAAIGDLCSWVCNRKHSIALTAIDIESFKSSPLSNHIDIWSAAALHIALQIQRLHQSLKKNKGNTFLVFDEHKQKADSLAELLFDPPPWSDTFYGKKEKQPRLDQIIDTAFYARSHHVGLVQIADLFAFLFKRHVELSDHGSMEAYQGEAERIREWVLELATRLTKRPSRWPKRSTSECAKWYVDLAPQSLLTLPQSL